ncbi:hypothetical protein SVIO_083390 [Streptomyces violaceusniger]|uniref:Uncharacterized protein n=1 Tax=Streptomyces violaceusniger TaxID=68280 RepID=A0A4D4LEQ2_STRVO|nr:hypothetical protein SVIO_083390 [Streptomyces violaceusniger]
MLAFLPMVAGLMLASTLVTTVLVPHIGPKPVVPLGMGIAAAGMAWLNRPGSTRRVAVWRTTGPTPRVRGAVEAGQVRDPADGTILAGAGSKLRYLYVYLTSGSLQSTSINQHSKHMHCVVHATNASAPSISFLKTCTGVSTASHRFPTMASNDRK